MMVLNKNAHGYLDPRKKAIEKDQFLVSQYATFNALKAIIGFFQKQGQASNENNPNELKPTGISGEFWDPFEGHLYIKEDPSLNKEVTTYLPAFFGNFSGLFLIVGLTGFVIGTLAQFHILSHEDIYILGGFGAFAASIALILFLDGMTGGDKAQTRPLKLMADALGYAFRVKIPDERMQKIGRNLLEFFKLRIASAIPLNIDSEMWGFSKKEKIPLWIGVSLTKSSSYLGGPKAQRKGEMGAIRGQLFMFVIGYELERNTRVKVQLFPEFKTPLGPLDIDIQTESVQFNSKYNIRLTCEDGKSLAKNMSADLLQVLTPAFQDTLICLADRFATRIIIDGNTVFFAGCRNLVSDDQAELERMLLETLEECASAAVSLKRFAE